MINKEILRLIENELKERKKAIDEIKNMNESELSKRREVLIKKIHRGILE